MQYVKNERGTGGDDDPATPFGALGTFDHFVDFVRHETMGLAMNSLRGVLVGRFDKTPDSTRPFVEPILVILDAIFALNLHILHVGVCQRLGVDTRNTSMDIEKQRHRPFSLPHLLPVCA